MQKYNQAVQPDLKRLPLQELVDNDKRVQRVCAAIQRAFPNVKASGITYRALHASLKGQKAGKNVHGTISACMAYLHCGEWCIACWLWYAGCVNQNEWSDNVCDALELHGQVIWTSWMANDKDEQQQLLTLEGNRDAHSNRLQLAYIYT